MHLDLRVCASATRCRPSAWKAVPMQPDLTELEARLWDAADELRANSGAQGE